MFSIGEFARLGGVSARTLRHYDEIGLLRPAAVDTGTGNRGYSAAQQVFEIQLAFTRQEARQAETRAGQAGEG
jgi:DNA-binding transcriptional MerR regulator